MMKSIVSRCSCEALHNIFSFFVKYLDTFHMDLKRDSKIGNNLVSELAVEHVSRRNESTLDIKQNIFIKIFDKTFVYSFL